MMKQTQLKAFFINTPVNNNNNNDCVKRTILPSIDCQYWQLLPRLLRFIDFETLYKEIQPLVKGYSYVDPNGNEYESKRLSCKLLDGGDGRKPNALNSGIFNYDKLPNYDWTACQSLVAVRAQVETQFQERYDYCLIHLYRNGEDKIEWHADRESLNSSVCSVSFGATRVFRFRAINETTGHHTQYELHHGDVLYMKKGCQQHFKHQVPTTKKVKERRINLTFRKFDSGYAVQPTTKYNPINNNDIIITNVSSRTATTSTHHDSDSIQSLIIRF